MVGSKEPGLTGSFSIRALDEVLAGMDMVQELHRHDFFYILALKKGTGSHKIDFNTYKVCDASVFIMRPGQVHEITLKSESEGYLLQFNSEFYKPRDEDSKASFRKATKVALHQPADFEKIIFILSNILHEFNYRQQQYLGAINAYLDIFFLELSRQAKGSVNNGNAYNQDRLDEFLELLEKHVVTHKRASQYARMLNLSLYQLNAITKAALGKSCTTAIQDYILLESKRYLAGTSNQVNQIAYQLGFEDVSYFTRFFKKQTGYSPQSFRKKLK
jgi:AraC-like DNA-binding protein